jgi:RHS repeat-associated protein
MDGCWARLALAIAVAVCAPLLTSTARAQPVLGGPAPLPMCTVAGWPQCIGPTAVQGIQAALQTHCDQFAAAHKSDGGIVWCGQQGSGNTTCQLNQPAIAPAFVGASWAATRITMAGRDVVPFNYGGTTGQVFRTWGAGHYAGPVCACPANALITAEATCACPAGMNWSEAAQRCLPKPPEPLVISLSGRTHTRAMPAGPPLPLAATVTKGGQLHAAALVTVRLDGVNAYSGVTDAAGQMGFTYVPPVLQSATVPVVATCLGCVNEAELTLVVDTPPICEPGLGNPIRPGNGEKLQDESDWADHAAHPISVVRHYSSHGNAPAGLGPTAGGGWSHPYAGQLQVQGGLRRVVLGDGTSVRFEGVASSPGQWLPDNHLDSLNEDSAGWLYVRAADDSRYRFDTAGRLLAIARRGGQVLQLSYSATGLLVAVNNAFGRALGFGYDEAGRLVAVATPDGQTLRYGYEGVGDGARLTLVTHPDGSQRRYHYEDPRWPQALTGITDEADLRVSSFEYDAQGRAVGTTRAGGVGSYSVRFESPSSASPGSKGGLIAPGPLDASAYRLQADITDPLGNATRHVWVGAEGQMRRQGASAPLAGSLVADRLFGPAALPLIETDFLGVRTERQWDALRQLPLSTTRAAGLPESQTTQTQWHPSLRLPLRVSEAGRTTDHAYDEAGNVLTRSVTDAATGQTRTEAWTYTPQGLPETYADPTGALWRYEYDNQGRRTRITDPLGRATRFTHDGAGRVLTQTDPTGLVTSYAYDARGRLLSEARGAEFTAYGYTATGRLAAVQRPNGHRIEYRWDAAGRLLGASDNRGADISFSLDAQGNRLREEVRGPGGQIERVTTRVINALNRVTALSNAAGQTTTHSYDANGQPVARTSPLGQTTVQTLDGLGRTTRTTLPDNASAAQAWSGLGELSSFTDPKGVTTAFNTNAFGEVVSESSPDSGTVVYGRDGAGRIVSITDAKGPVQRIERDALGRVSRIQHAPGHEAHIAYDAADRITVLEDKSGSTRYERDAQGRILRKVQAVNDNPSNPTQLRVGYAWNGGELDSVTYPSGLRLTYRRVAGRIVGIDLQLPGQQRGRNPSTQAWLTDLTHTALGQPRAWRWSSGDAAQRGFDADGRITSTEFARYETDAAGRITRITHDLWAQGPGRRKPHQTSLTWQVGYDSRDRITRFAREGAERRYSYDTNSNRLAAIDSVEGEADLDAPQGLANLRRTQTEALQIESTSNRLQAIARTLRLTQAGREQGTQDSQVSYELDANGALISDGVRRFDYDASGRLEALRFMHTAPAQGHGQVQPQAQRIDYLHNALGQRVFKGEPRADDPTPQEQSLGQRFIDWLRRLFAALFLPERAATSVGTAYLYGDPDGPLPAWAMLGEYDNGSAQGKGASEYLWLPTEDGGAIPVGLYRRGRLYAIHPDHLGTPRLMTDDDNEVVWQWPYSAFGDNNPTGVLRATNQSPVRLKATEPTELNLRMPGQYFDEETGTFQNYFRDYDPAVGRYRQADPIGLEGGSNPFGYLGGNPLSHVDPEGLQSTPKGLLRRPTDATPLEGGGGGFGGPAVGGRSPFGGASPLGNHCPPDLKNTLDRIKAGQGYPHRNDGSVFQNREGLLPMKPEGYYREWVHPTAGAKGPGPQRVVTGHGGEAYYSPDHYRSFIPAP